MKTDDIASEAGLSSSAAQEVGSAIARHSNEIIVKFKNGMADTALIRQQNAYINEKILTEAMKSAGYTGLHLIQVPSGAEKALQAFVNNPNVEWANLNRPVKHTAYAPTNDPSYGSLWGMTNISAPTVWNAGNTGDQKVFIGVIDEGIQYFHEDLCGQIWDNPYETENGRDDDGNGYIDDMHGYDFYNYDNTIFDNRDDHGTHVSGTIGAVGNNGKGVVGVSPNVTIIGAKFLEGSGYTSDAVKAIDYITDLKTRHGLNIAATSNSWGGGGYDQALYDAVNRSKAKDILFVAAAGNNGTDVDVSPFYPSCFNLDNIISVLAYDNTGNKASWSNYGATNVDIGAPGVSILSTVPNTAKIYTYAYYSGTSMATPHVSGAVALYKAGNPSATYLQVKNAILSNAKPNANLTGKCVTGGMLDVSKFTQVTSNSQLSRTCVVPPMDSVPPTIPQNFRVVGIGSTSVTFAYDWSTDDWSGVYLYRISSRPASCTSCSWSGWHTNGVNPLEVPYLTTGTQYAFTIAAVDFNSNWSPESSLAILETPRVISDVTPPSAPVASTLGKTLNSISLGWTKSTDDIGVYGYRVYYKSSDNVTYPSTWRLWTTTSMYYSTTITGLYNSTSYDIYVEAYDNVGNKTSSNIITQRTDGPTYTLSTSLSGSVSKKTNQKLNWTTTISPTGWRIVKTELQNVQSGWWTTIYTQTTQALTGTYTIVVNNRYTQSYRVITTLASGEVGTSNTVGLVSQVR